MKMSSFDEQCSLWRFPCTSIIWRYDTCLQHLAAGPEIKNEKLIFSKRSNITWQKRKQANYQEQVKKNTRSPRRVLNMCNAIETYHLLIFMSSWKCSCNFTIVYMKMFIIVQSKFNKNKLSLDISSSIQLFVVWKKPQMECWISYNPYPSILCPRLFGVGPFCIQCLRVGGSKNKLPSLKATLVQNY